MKKGYGFDRLSRDALVLAAALSLAAAVLWSTLAGRICSIVSTLLLALVLFRAFSTKTERRQDELLGYERIMDALGGSFKGIFGKSGAKAPKERGYRYFKCPQCAKSYRAPRGKGRIRVTCSDCGCVFEKKV